MSFWVSGIRFNITLESSLVGQPLLAALVSPAGLSEDSHEWLSYYEHKNLFSYDGIVDLRGFPLNMPLETPLLELHRSSGATIGEYFGTRLPVAIRRIRGGICGAAQETVALVDTNYRAFFSFAGPDRQRYLNALLTSNVRDLKPGQGTVGLLLNPQGHILAEDRNICAGGQNPGDLSHAMIRERTYSTFEQIHHHGRCHARRRDRLRLERWTWRGRALRQLLAELGVRNFADMPLLSHEEVMLGQIPCRIVRRELAGEPAADADRPARITFANLWRELAMRVRIRRRRARWHGGAEFRAARVRRRRGLASTTTTSKFRTRPGLEIRTSTTKRDATPDKKSSSGFARAVTSTGGSRSCSFLAAVGPASRHEPAVRGK